MLPFPIIYDEGYDLNFGDHVFQTAKYRMIRELLLRRRVASPEDFLAPSAATREQLHSVHAAQDLFPANYGALAQSVLTAIRTIGGEALIRDVFETRRAQLKSRIGKRLSDRLPHDATLWERVREVASYQDETGYLGRAARDADGSIRLREHNCAIAGVSVP